MNRRSMSDDKEFQIQRLSQALEVSNRTIKSLEERISNAAQLLKIAEQEKKNWEQQKILQDRIMKQQLEAADAEKRKLEQEIMELRVKLKAA